MAEFRDHLTFVITATDQRLVDALAVAVRDREPVVLATVVATSRSVPRRAGAKMLIYGDGRLLGTVGGGEMESRVIAAARTCLDTGRTDLLNYSLLEPERGDPGVCGGDATIYLEPYMPAPTVLVIGCGHVGAAVIDLAHWLGYRTIGVDDRADRIDEAVVPNADHRFAGTVEEFLAANELTADTAAVLVTRDVDVDVDAIPRLLERPLGYLGVMGSERRWMATRRRLVDGGVAPDALDGIRVPIGLEIAAETVEEIAVAIMAEVIASVRHADG